MTLTTKGIESSGQCTATAITTGVVSAIITALLVACISLAIQITVYQYVYKPRLRSFTATAAVSGRGHSLQREDATGYHDSVAYDVVGERCIETTMEMKRNDAYSAGERVVGGLTLKQNEAYGVARST